MKELTRAEEQIIKILWEIKEGVIHEIIERLPSPKPAYNTVSTIVRILEKKEFVSHRAYGKTYVYFPIVDKKTYSNFFLKNFMSGYFNGSFENLLSFFVKENNLSLSEVDELLKYLKEDLNKKQDGTSD